jgi:hypothetical protein
MASVPNRILEVKVTTDLAEEPVTVSELKDFAKIPFADDDTVLAYVLKSATRLLEKLCGLKFGVATIECSFTHNGYREITMPYGKVDDVTALEFRPCRLTDWDATYINDEGENWEMEGDKFISSSEGHFKITYTTDTEVTEEIKTAIKIQAKHMAMNRDDEKAILQVQPIVKSMLPVRGDLL